MRAGGRVAARCRRLSIAPPPPRPFTYHLLPIGATIAAIARHFLQTSRQRSKIRLLQTDCLAANRGDGGFLAAVAR